MKRLFPPADGWHGHARRGRPWLTPRRRHADHLDRVAVGAEVGGGRAGACRRRILGFLGEVVAWLRAAKKAAARLKKKLKNR